MVGGLPGPSQDSKCLDRIKVPTCPEPTSSWGGGRYSYMLPICLWVRGSGEAGRREWPLWELHMPRAGTRTRAIPRDCLEGRREGPPSHPADKKL